MSSIPVWVRNAIVVIAATIVVVALTFCGRVQAAEADDDAAKWHVGEEANASGYFCATAEAAAQGAVIMDGMVGADGIYRIQTSAAPMAAVGCVYRSLELVMFRGVVPGSKVYRTAHGLRWHFVDWILLDTGFHAYGFMSADHFSDRPYIAPGSL